MVTFSHTAKVLFYRDCYIADNRELAIWNVLSKQLEQRRFFDHSLVAQLQDSGQLPLPQDYCQPLAQQIQTYRREKSLLFVTDFVVGTQSDETQGGRARIIRAPLNIYEADLAATDSASLVISPDSHRWNPAAISILFSTGEGIEALESLRAKTQDQLSLDLFALSTRLKELNDSDLDITIEGDYCSENRLKKFRTSTNRLILCQGAALLLATRSTASRGCIDELNLISEQSDISAPMRTLLALDAEATPNPVAKTGQPNISGSPAPAEIDNVPGLLSHSQQSALHNAANKVLSILIGPPGTGKSYTIACIAMERFLKGESVLVVSSNEHAVDVVQNKLVEQLGISANAILRAGNHDYLRQLKNYLDEVTRNSALEDPGQSKMPAIKDVRNRLERLETEFLRSGQRAVKDGIYASLALDSARGASLWQGLLIWWMRQRWRKSGYLYEQLHQIQQLHRERERLLASQISHVYGSALQKTLNQHRKELVTFLRGLKARTSHRQGNLFEEVDYQVLLKALPIWCCSLAGLHRALPLKPELFDLVIVDESTQCDIASSIPALYRAKRAVIVGDPKQLRHVSFLSRNKEHSLRNKHGLHNSSMMSYRDDSLIDLANAMVTSQKAVVLLDEHYRSVPELISFSNRRFYQNQLRVMTAKPTQVQRRGLEVKIIRDGERRQGVNQKEAESLLVHLADLLEKQKNVTEDYRLTFGVLSFFREQADYLQQLLLERIDFSTLARHKLRASTPYGFQGEERDIMLISCAVDDNTSAMTYRYLNREDVFNVAVTRAREVQTLFVSATPENVPANSLLREYLEAHFQQQSQPVVEVFTSRERYLEDIAQELASTGAYLLRNYSVAGITLDLVVCKEFHAIALDLIGFPGEHQDVLHLDHYKIFERAGLTLFPLSYFAWKFARQDVLKKLIAIFQSLQEKDAAIRRSELLVTHWHKLLVHDDNLARRVRLLEQELGTTEADKVKIQVADLVHQYCHLLSVLNRKLESTELTFTRYASAARQVVESCIDNMNSYVLMTRSMERSPSADNADLELSEPDNSDQATSEPSKLELSTVQQQQRQLQKVMSDLYNYNEMAIERLQTMALTWAGQQPTQEVANESLVEMDRLIGLIQEYSVKA